jgi:NAD(P)-dependent dehydrogenase (short-subunit alcohol dehydrogenase family)
MKALNLTSANDRNQERKKESKYMKKLEGKVALVTGGGSGIGLATAKLFKENGATVIITARNKDSLEKAKTEYGNIFDLVLTDVSKPEDLDRLYAHIKSKYSGLDVVFANAGVAGFQPTTDVTVESYNTLFDTNVRGVFFTVAKALPLLKKGSSVILTSSALGTKGTAGGAAYSAGKAAVRSFARSWTAEIPVENIRFNVLSPGPVETPIYGKMGLTQEQIGGMSNALIAGIPARRFGQSDEIAKVALFLASSDSSYIVGADISADGGFAQV